MSYQSKVRIEFIDGTSQTIDGVFRTRIWEGMLGIRLSHNTAYPEEWVHFPLANIKSWRVEQ